MVVRWSRRTNLERGDQREIQMLVRDLPAPVTASKADWLPGATWLGFTPSDGSLQARARCQATIKKQFGSGYVLEYITANFGQPNPGFEADVDYLREREEHRHIGGRLLAIHRLQPNFKPLRDLIGSEEYARIQDMWSQGADRIRWSVAFPIVETFEIEGRPSAREVFGEAGYRRLYAHPSKTLRPLKDEERHLLGELSIIRREVRNAWIAVEDEFAAADRSEIDPKTLTDIGDDLSDQALEGFTAEQWAKIRRRAAWLAEGFVRRRREAGTLSCDHCRLDPVSLIGQHNITPRSLLDVHHKHPISLGTRYSRIADFALLCPTCHRLEHRLLAGNSSLFPGE
ncbi:HNH endonuclease [Phenylobacterium sp.]|uniref:HNH endonuclease n=1 Tax=Phenylobacterium sp. TaxID=1871053 RepID=UPI002737A742|nr:HNH endonuclease [Phenylobacterium sp.]MDP3870421.1 HNH endonuclease [Phenylobacterium sp.]